MVAETPVPLADLGKYTKNAWGLDTSSLFKGNTPFHHTVSELVAAGATVRPHNVAENWWAGGRQNEKPWDETPVYVGLAGQATHTVSCPMFHGLCNAAGLAVRLPAGARPQKDNPDHHIAVIDLVLQQEVDLWLCPTSGGTNCGSGGAYPLTGPKATGLVVGRGSPGSGNAGGFAFGVMQITAGDLLAASANGTSIPHALGMGANCIDNTGPHYPSAHGADYYCADLAAKGLGPNTPTPNVVYGDLLFLSASYAIPSNASGYCQAILRTLKTHGAYVYDVAPGWGSSLHAENPQTYMSGSNPWDTIATAMVNAGEGYGSGSSFGFSCENRWTGPNDWSVLVLNQGGEALFRNENASRAIRELHGR